MMKTKLSAGLVSLLLLGACSGSSVSEPEIITLTPEEENQETPFEPSQFTYIETPLTQSEVGRMSRFEVSLLKDLCDNDQGNVVYSPISVITTMTMLLNGGDEETCQEFIDLLSGGYSAIFPEKNLTMERLNEHCRIMVNQLPVADNQCPFTIKNSIWHTPSITLLPAFADIMTQTFDADELKINPSGKESMDLINKWVSDATKGNMATFLKKPLENIDLAVINALCFKGTWSDKFDKELTRQLTFNNQSGTKTQTDFMETEEKVRGIVGRNVTAAEMEYGNGNFRLILLMPSEDSDFDRMLQQLKDEGLSHSSIGIGQHCFKVAMPKFESNFNLDLVENLKNIGVRKAFENGFNNIVNSTDPLFLTCFIHGANFIVDEEGSQGSAATLGGMWVGSSGYEPEVKEIAVFDRPFIYLVTEKSTDTILFMGCVRNL